MNETTISAGTAGGGIWRAIAASPIVIALAGGIAAKSPDIYEKAWEARNETGGRSRDFVAQQNIGFDRNPTCANLTPAWRKGLGGTQVAATICDNTGDILVVTKQPTGRMKQTWLTVEALTEPDDNPKLASLLVSPAYAAVPPPVRLPSPARATGIELAQAVICQTRIDARTVVRHVKLPDGCYDITIDTYSGTEKSRVKVPCKTSC